ncbi:MAG TPA: glycine--tRNA ligase [Candidatus Saccharimonadales bacterium]|nr:glycine--tRNA ligase [Candidatus Saccharimonadales bacterium]
MSEVKLEDIVSLAKRRGFVYPSSEVYGGLAGVYDYGPLGVRLKRNIVNAWLKFFVDGWDDMYQVDAGLLMNKKVWEASGHATGFNDPLVECNKCHSRFREDHVDHSKPCPVCGERDSYGQARMFNMMFKTHVGPVEDDESISYLRPETAQGIFVNFKNVVDSFYPDLPFGIAQVGKAFRNEISPREFLFRLRELEQMEIEYFVHPDDWEKQFEKWRKDTIDFFKKIGLPEDKIHELEVPEEDRAHYSKRTIDFEFDYPFGKRELSGLAYRTDFDLQNIQKASGKSMEYRPKDGSAAFVPHVIEPSFGVDRAVLAVLASAYTEDEVEGEKRIYLKLDPSIAPVKVAVSPLLKNKPELVEKAREVYKALKKEFGAVMWDDNGNIGKRYRRQDEIGTPYCVTIDFDTLTDNTVTVRNRDTTKQERIQADKLVEKIK